MKHQFETHIKPKGTWTALDLKEIWKYRDLVLILTWRDIRVRYKQTILGVVWVILQPLTTMVIFSIFFGHLAKIPSGKLPYTLFVLSGLIFWNFFSNALSYASNSLVDNEAIIKKVYFPRIILLIATIFTTFVDFSINFVILLLLAAFLGYMPNLWIIVLLPILVVITAITALGGGLLFSAINVKFRDVRYALPFVFQILIFVTPVIYPLTIVTPQNQMVMALNPMSSVIEILRSVLSGTPIIDIKLLSISLASMTVLFITGCWYFQKTERFFADIA